MVTNYYEYEEWVPLYGYTTVSERFGEAAKMTIGFSKATSHSFSANISGSGGPILVQLFGYSYSSSTGINGGQTLIGPVADSDESALIVPM